MRLVTDNEIPAAIGGLELVLHVLVARQLVETGDDEVGFEEPIAGPRCLQLIVREYLEGEVEAPEEFVLPLLCEAARANDEAALQVAAGDEFLNEQAGHDGLACAGIVGEQEAERLARQHALVDGGDLVREGLDHRGVNGEDGIEEMREMDALCLRDEAKQRAVTVEAQGRPSSTISRSGSRSR